MPKSKFDPGAAAGEVKLPSFVADYFQELSRFMGALVASSSFSAATKTGKAIKKLAQKLISSTKEVKIEILLTQLYPSICAHLFNNTANGYLVYAAEFLPKKGTTESIKSLILEVLDAKKDAFPPEVPPKDILTPYGGVFKDEIRLINDYLHKSPEKLKTMARRQGSLYHALVTVMRELIHEADANIKKNREKAMALFMTAAVIAGRALHLYYEEHTGVKTDKHLESVFKELNDAMGDVLE